MYINVLIIYKQDKKDMLCLQMGRRRENPLCFIKASFFHICCGKWHCNINLLKGCFKSKNGEGEWKEFIKALWEQLSMILKKREIGFFAIIYNSN